MRDCRAQKSESSGAARPPAAKQVQSVPEDDLLKELRSTPLNQKSTRE